ncbi:hypothetical protein [Paenibacillus sp. 598K]|uniref:hypothetical protein n=1 Tax=Paenibacillus sp. 598K TaxID=1117987 RepID=UPI000FFF37AD|nr:hypothetical protein [Paenibacillus sp. 598K]
MMKWLQRLLIGLLLLIVLLGLGLWGGLRYVAPQESLDLAAEPLRLGDKAQELLRGGRLELLLTEADVESLIKSELQAKPKVTAEAEITGARIELSGDRAIVHANVMYREQIPIGVVAAYRLSWQAPALVAEPESLHVRSIRLPSDQLDTLRFSFADQLPDFLEIGEVTFESDGVRIALKSEFSLEDLLDRLP